MGILEISKRNADDFINLMDFHIGGVLSEPLGMQITAAAAAAAGTMTRAERQVFHHVRPH